MIHRLDVHQDQNGSWDVLLGATGKLAFDIGANVGQSTRVLARGFEQVVALEPCAESFAILAKEMPENVFPLEVAAADHHGRLTLVEAERSIGTGQLVSTSTPLPMWGEEKGRREVPCTTVDSLARLFGVPDFVKCDVEGGEVGVIRGAADTMRRCPRAYIEIHNAGHESEIRSLLPDWEWEIIRHGDYVRKGGPVYQHHFWMVGTNTHA